MALVNAPIYKSDHRMCSWGWKGPCINGVMLAPRFQQSDRRLCSKGALEGFFINGVMLAP